MSSGCTENDISAQPHDTANTLTRLVGDDSGATLVEYGIIVLLIAVVSIAVLTVLGPKIANLYAPLAPAL